MDAHTITVAIGRDAPWTPGMRAQVEEMIGAALAGAGITATVAVSPPDAEPDAARIDELLAGGTWEPVWNDGTSRMLLDWRLAEAIGWECSSCRPDAGWAKSAYGRRAPDGIVTLAVECGHCGTVTAHARDGSLLGE